jgi:hypothetical protein
MIALAIKGTAAAVAKARWHLGRRAANSQNPAATAASITMF